MKSLYKPFIITLLFFSSNFGCVKEIKVAENFEPQVFIHGYLTNEIGVLNIQIENTVSVNSTTSNPVEAANISLFMKDENEVVSLVTDDFSVGTGSPRGLFSSNEPIIPEIGKQYWIEVEIPNGASFRSEPEFLKNPVQINNVTKEDGMVRVIFSDPVDISNYYLVNFSFYDEGDNLVGTEFEISNDVLFKGNENAFIETLDYSWLNNGRVEAELININLSTYQFYLNVLAQNNSNEGFEDESGDPSRLFAPPPAHLQGNIINTTANTFALGNFGLLSSSNAPVAFGQGIHAYTHINIFNGIEMSIQTDQTVVVDVAAGEIMAVFNTGSQTLDESIEVFDMNGKYMIPGLIEGHYHLATTNGEQIDLGLRSMQNMFKQGITTVRDMAGNGVALRQLQELGSNRIRALPKVNFASLIAGQDFLESDPRVADTAGNGTAGQEPWFALLNDATNVGQLINDAREFGCTALKLYSDISPENARRVLEEAHRQNFPVWSHSTLFNASPWDVADANSLSHGDMLNFVTVEPVPTEVEFNGDYIEVFDLTTISSAKMFEYFNLLKQNGTVLEPTLSVYLEAGPEELEVQNFANTIAAAAYENGVIMGVGSDGGNDDVTENNFLLLREMELMSQITGMSNFEVIKATTLNNARALGMEQDLGTIEIGKTADLVILGANPSDNLGNLRTVEMVIKEGIAFAIQ